MSGCMTDEHWQHIDTLHSEMKAVIVVKCLRSRVSLEWLNVMT